MNYRMWALMMVMAGGVLFAACGGDEEPTVTPCMSDSECDDGNDCNGDEACVLGTCGSGAAPEDGTSCTGDDSGMGVCRDEVCITGNCGDGVVDEAAGEECDDGNTTAGDGCEANCQYTCEEDSECDNEDSCDGVETCDTSSNTCVMGTAVDCSELDDMCNVGECVPGRTGECQRRPVSEGMMCDDGDPTTSNSACFVGRCSPEGHAVVMGHDFSDRSVTATQILGNAVRLTSRAVGHVVLIGHNFSTLSEGPSRVVANAALLANTADSIRIFEYRQFADNSRGGSAEQVRNAINVGLMRAGRRASYTSIMGPAELFDLSEADVLLVPPQSECSGECPELETLGTELSRTLDTFTARGGVVIVCDTDNQGSRLVTRDGLFSDFRINTMRTGTELILSQPTSPLLDGVTSYVATERTISFNELRGGKLIVGSGAGAPVVQHFSTPIRITEFVQYADPDASSGTPVRTRAAIRESLVSVGWDPLFARLTDFNRLDLGASDVLLIHSQENGTESVLTAVGMAWRERVLEFIGRGGVVIGLDNANTTARIMNAIGLFSISNSTRTRAGEELRVVAPENPLAEGLAAETYVAPTDTHSLSGDIEGTVVVTTRTDRPVVVHRPRGGG